MCAGLLLVLGRLSWALNCVRCVFTSTLVPGACQQILLVTLLTFYVIGVSMSLIIVR